MVAAVTGRARRYVVSALHGEVVVDCCDSALLPGGVGRRVDLWLRRAVRLLRVFRTSDLRRICRTRPGNQLADSTAPDTIEIISRVIAHREERRGVALVLQLGMVVA